MVFTRTSILWVGWGAWCCGDGLLHFDVDLMVCDAAQGWGCGRMKRQCDKQAVQSMMMMLEGVLMYTKYVLGGGLGRP